MRKSVHLSNALLRAVEKPSRYVGGEWNSVIKDDTVKTRFALCFPDIYEIGMSNLALSILYQQINARDDCWCERVYQPAADMRQKMQEQDIPLFSLESKTPLSAFDIVGFTLQYELSYVTILDMLRSGGIPLYSKDRTDTDPLVVAGGPCAVNAEPVADFFDLIVVGEAELLLETLLDLWAASESKTSFLEKASRLEGVYVPAFYEDLYDRDGKLTGFHKLNEDAALPIKRTLVKDLSQAFLPLRPIVPNSEIVHDRMVLELFRGCTRGCRFCQAGQIYRPVRERDKDTLVRQAQALMDATGYDELGLLSLSTSDYSALETLTDDLLPLLTPRGVNLSLPSLRLDNFSFDLMKKASSTRKAGLTFAIEAGSERLRNRINKNIREDDVLEAARIAFSGGWRTLKFYLMLGLPGETDEDVDAISDIVFKVIDAYYELPAAERRKPPTITVSASFFIPKPWTPFQWAKMLPEDEYDRRVKHLTERLRHRFIRFNWHDRDMAVIEAVLARGDRRLAPVLVSVLERGGTQDSWREHFSYERWLDALAGHGLTTDDYTRGRETSERFVWDKIDIGVTKRFLQREWDLAGEDCMSHDCMTECLHCGANRFNCGVCLTHAG